MANSRVFPLIILMQMMEFMSMQESGGWDVKLLELKSMISSLDSKVSSLESRMMDLKVLEYAFKVNSVDNNLRSIDSKMIRIENELSKIRESSQKFCPDSRAIERLVQEPRGTNRMDGTEQTIKVVEEKLNDYVVKSLKSNEALQETGQQQKQILETIHGTIRNGLTKIYNKLDEALKMEGQISRMTQSITGIPATISHLSEQLFDMSNELQTVKEKVENNGKQSSEKTKIDNNEPTNQRSVPVDLLNYAVKMGDAIKKDLTKLQNLKPNITDIHTVAKQIDTVLRFSNVTAIGRIRNEFANMTLAIGKLKETALPLLESVEIVFDSLNSFLKDVAYSLGNDTISCGYQEMIRLEFSKFTQSMMSRCEMHIPSENMRPSFGSKWFRPSIISARERLLKHCVEVHLESSSTTTESLGKVFG